MAVPLTNDSPVWAAPSASLISLVPARILDTRVGTGATIDGIAQREGVLGSNSSRSLHVTGRGGVPATGVDAVVLNVTAVNQTLSTFITVWPTGITRPGTSNLNPSPGITAPNLVIVKVGAGGNIDLYNSTGTVDLIADVAGYMPSFGTYTTVTPGRIMDSRLVSEGTVDGLAQHFGALGPAQIYSLQVTGRAGVPGGGVGAVAINITAANQTADTFITAFPSDSARTNTSNLNPKPGIVAPNMAIVKVGADGKINLFNAEGATDLIVDIVGWFPTDPTYTPLTPARLLDTRNIPSAVTDDGIGARVGSISPNGVRTIRVAGRGGVPLNFVGAVVLNVTAINQTSTSFITAFPAGQSRPNSSNLNPTPGITAPNLVIAQVGPNGDVSLYNSTGTVDLIVDVAGWFKGTPLQSNTLNRIAAGEDHTCAITATATVKCVGKNEHGQLGQPLTVLSSSTPVAVPNLADVVSVDSGKWTTCAVLGDSTVKCWGGERSLGTGATVDTPTPTAVPFLSGVVSVTSDYFQTCALTVNAAVYCWGDNTLGKGAVGPAAVGIARFPVPVIAAAGAIQVSTGFELSCATMGDGSVRCWGQGNAIPSTIVGVGGAAAVTIGTQHACVLFAAGGVACTGNNLAGQLGQAGGNSSTYLNVPGVSGMIGIEAGQFHTCAWAANGIAKCWGGNNQGQVGDGLATFATSDPTADPVAVLSTITEISASNQTCATTVQFTYYCWGSNPGTLGFATLPAPNVGRQGTPQLMVGL